MKSKNRIAPISLAKGQVWKLEDKHLEIMEVGKTLTHYRLYRNQKRVPISLGGIQTVTDYLRSKGATLIKERPVVKEKAAEVVSAGKRS